MRLQELAQVLDLEELTPAGADPTAENGAPGADTAAEDGGYASDTAGTVAEADITRAYASDLLSDVLANAPTGGILITLQVHLNVIAVASHAGLRAVIFSCGRTPEPDVVEKAAEEGLALYLSRADTFDIAGRLYELGLRGGSG